MFGYFYSYFYLTKKFKERKIEFDLWTVMVLIHHRIEDMKEFMVAKTGSHDVGPAT